MWLRELAVRTYPTRTYFLLADFAPYDASALTETLKTQGIFIKPLLDDRLSPGFMGVTTALPDDNSRFLTAIEEVLDDA